MLIRVGIGLLIAWSILVAVLMVRRPAGVREAARLVPDTLRLLRRIAADRAVPRSTRIPLWLSVGYLASPLDLIPDFLPGIGHVDDVIVVAITLRWVIRRVGPDVLRAHWPGTDDGLSRLLRLAGRA